MTGHIVCFGEAMLRLSTTPGHLIAQAGTLEVFAGTPQPEVSAVIRLLGIATVDGLVVPGVRAAAAPVFNMHGDCVAVVCALGPAGGLDADPAGWMVAAVIDCANNISRCLGYGTTQA